MSVTVFARDKRLPDLCVEEMGSVHRVTQMFLRVDGTEPEEAPYSVECGLLVTGCALSLGPVNCLGCIAGEESLLAALKNRR